MQRLRNTQASLPLMPMIRVSLLTLASLWVLTGCQKHESASPESIVEVEGDVALVGDWQTLFPEGRNHLLRWLSLQIFRSPRRVRQASNISPRRWRLLV